MALKFSTHKEWPGRTWYFKAWRRVRSIFAKPKFTASNLEPAQKITFISSPNFGEARKKGERIIIKKHYPLFMSNKTYEKYKEFLDEKGTD